MSAQRLNRKKTRKLAEATGLPVIRAWAHGGYMYDFVTQGHLHGWYNLKTGQWGIEIEHIIHYDTCSPELPGAGEDPLFSDGVPSLTDSEKLALERASKV